MNAATALLQKYWGFGQLRSTQKTAIQHILNGDDVIALLPTGGGKSVCFQIPALLNDGICLVISPLISLMQDQVEALEAKGLKAMMLGGTLSFQELQTQLDNCIYGPYKFLYISPERLQNPYVQERLQEMHLNLIAIDEAHCISEWGHDFRPAYRKINLLRDLKPKVPTIALTATATEQVLTDIRINLKLEKAKLVSQSFERKNIALLIHKSEDKNYELVKFLQKNKGTSIVYVRNRKLSVELERYLNHYQIKAKAFHGGMDVNLKKNILQDWKAEKFDVIVGTTAFGMGIDKANVRNIVHYQLPESLESYYQEVGRAGRDNQEAKAFLVYNNADLLTLKDQFLKNIPTVEALKFIYKKINAYFSIAYGEGQEQDYNFNFSEFCHTYGLNFQLTFNTMQLLDQLGVLHISNEYRQRTELSFKISPNHLYGFLDENPSFKPLIHSLLRMQGGFFEFKTPIDLYQLQAHSGLNQKEILTQFEKLEHQGIIDLDVADQDTTIKMLVPREDQHTLNPLVPYLKKYQKNKTEKIHAVLKFVEDNEHCKTKQLLSYFDEIKSTDCRHCSVCYHRYRSKTVIDRKNLRKSILNHLRTPLNSKELLNIIDQDKATVLTYLRQLLDEKKIKRLDDNRFIITED